MAAIRHVTVYGIEAHSISSISMNSALYKSGEVSITEEFLFASRPILRWIRSLRVMKNVDLHNLEKDVRAEEKAKDKERWRHSSCVGTNADKVCLWDGGGVGKRSPVQKMQMEKKKKNGNLTPSR